MTMTRAESAANARSYRTRAKHERMADLIIREGGAGILAEKLRAAGWIVDVYPPAIVDRDGGTWYRDENGRTYSFPHSSIVVHWTMEEIREEFGIQGEKP